MRGLKMANRLAGPPQQALLGALRDVSAERGLTLDGVAREVGLGHMLRRVEAGEDELRLREVTALSAALGVRMSELTIRAEALALGEGER